MNPAGPFARPLHAFVLLATFVVGCGGSSPPPAAPAATTSAQSDVATASQPTFEARAVGPLTETTPLQIVSIFPYDAGETLISPAAEIGGFLSDARTHQGFGKTPFQAMVVTPTPTTIKAARLVAIAWGPRADFSLDRARAMGHAAMKEALQSGVVEMAYAPIARDQGVTSISADEVAAAFIEGAVVEYRDEQKGDPAKHFVLKRVTYEAGPAFVDAVSKAVARGVEAGHTAPVTH